MAVDGRGGGGSNGSGGSGGGGGGKGRGGNRCRDDYGRGSRYGGGSSDGHVVDVKQGFADDHVIKEIQD